MFTCVNASNKQFYWHASLVPLCATFDHYLNPCTWRVVITQPVWGRDNWRIMSTQQRVLFVVVGLIVSVLKVQGKKSLCFSWNDNELIQVRFPRKFLIRFKFRSILASTAMEFSFNFLKMGHCQRILSTDLSEHQSEWWRRFSSRQARLQQNIFFEKLRIVCLFCNLIFFLGGGCFSP